MDKFMNGNYNDSIEYWENILEKETISNNERLILLNNIATAELKLELYRKCLKTTQMIIDNDERFLSSYLIQGKAYIGIFKHDKAIEIWSKALQYCSNSDLMCDCSIILELQNLINNHKQNNIILDNHNEINNQNSNNNNNSIKIDDQNKNNIKIDDQNKNNIKIDQKNNIKIDQNKHDLNKSKSNSNISKSDLVKLYEEYILGKQIESSLRILRSNLSFASGDNMIDDLIAFGYLQVNTGKLEMACQIFSKLLQYNDNLPAAYLGLGSANAMLGQFDEAISLFSKVIVKDATIADAWKRRGQTKAAKGLLKDALSDLEKAVELGTDGDVYYQIGLVYHQCKNFRKALDQFRKALEKGVNTSSLHNFIGICEGQLGNIDESLKAHELAIQIDPNFKESHLNHTLMLKEVGRWKEAQSGFEKLDGNQTFHQSLNYRATFLYQLGDPLESFKYSVKALEVLQKTGNVEINSLILAANAMHSIGHYKTAIIYYDKALAIDSSNFCWFQREIALFTWNRLDKPLYQLNDDLNPRIKDGFCKKSKWQQIIHNYVPLSPPKEIPSFEDLDGKYNVEKQEVMLNMIKPLIHLVQLNARGFLPNKRQHKSFGLAVLEMAQTIRATIRSGGQTSSKLTWRKFFDIAVRWRHISEPGDPVFWIDTLPRNAFEDGFGLQTPIVNGQLKTIRYYSYFPLAFKRMKSLLESGYFNIEGKKEVLDSSRKKLLETANSLESIRQIVGQDFYVIVPCESDQYRGSIMEGTRLTLLSHEPEGFEFSIRTPGLPHRWSVFDKELQIIFDKLMGMISENATIFERKEEIVSLVLKLYYYWVIFAPITRGTALCGYAAISAILQAAGFEIKSPLPKDKQLDWEAIFANNYEAFLHVAMPMLEVGESSIGITSIQFNNIDSIQLNNNIKTLRDMIKILNT